MSNIGFIGLGNMGLPMAINLVKAGHKVTGFDLQPTALTNFSAAGGQKASELLDAIQNQDVIITMLQTGQQVKQVCLGETGVFAHAADKTLMIDCSSIDVQSSRELHEQAAKKHFMYLDAPVSGGVKGAAGASLTFMVGGDSEAFNLAKPLFDAMGKTIIHTGVAGTGQAAKICNNMILGISMIAVSEAFTLAQSLGLTPQKFLDVVSHASGQCWVTEKYLPVPNVMDNVPANNEYQAGFSVAMMLKDLWLSQHSAEAVGLKTPMGQQAAQLYQHFHDQGTGHLDFSAIIKLLE